MKQTTEEAAYDYATEKTKFRKDVLKEVDADSYVFRHSDCMEDFQCGYNYCKEQSPWISVDECLPLSDDDLYIALDTKMKPPGCGVCAFNPNTKKWTDSKGCIVLPTHWMPIPKLNQ